MQLDLRQLLAAVEDASPVDVVDVLGEQLVRAVDARQVSLLIANFSGDALARLSYVSGSGPEDGVDWYGDTGVRTATNGASQSRTTRSTD